MTAKKQNQKSEKVDPQTMEELAQKNQEPEAEAAEAAKPEPEKQKKPTARKKKDKYFTKHLFIKNYGKVYRGDVCTDADRAAFHAAQLSMNNGKPSINEANKILENYLTSEDPLKDPKERKKVEILKTVDQKK